MQIFYKKLSYFFILRSNRNMKARLTPLVLNKDFACALVVEQHLTEYQLQVILVHEIIGARNLVVAIVSDVESRAVAVA